jgi:hypothetical protein
MTIDEYKALYPQDAVYIQVDDTERLMTDEEYEAWVEQGVYNSNHPSQRSARVDGQYNAPRRPRVRS